MDIQGQTDRLYDRSAPRYEDEPGHGIGSDEELAAWRNDLSAVLANLAGTQVVDVGCGPGVLSRLLGEVGCQVTGVDSAPQMVTVAQHRLPPSLTERVSYLVGDTHTDLFPADSFDAVVSRQVVCHLHDPLRAFRHWHRWVKPGGTVMVIDGFWSREGWSKGSLGGSVDHLPLSCLQTIGTAAYLLEEAGFTISHRGLMESVNQEMTKIDQNSPRYLILGQKPPS